MSQTRDRTPSPKIRDRPVKVVVWDLDGTLWDGTLLEGDTCPLREGVLDLIVALDERGIVQSIASRNDPEAARLKLEALEIAPYFLIPQIHWGAKSKSVMDIATRLNLAPDAILFVDDQEFERAEVQAGAPGVTVFAADRLDELLNPNVIGLQVITPEGRHRRQMYIDDLTRAECEASFEGPRDAFLSSLNLRLDVRPATVKDLDRAEELTERTNQLNSTGMPFSRSELEAYIHSPNHRLMVASLGDRFGHYGTIGVLLIDCGDLAWTLKLILVSCRVLSRGIGALLINLTFLEAVKRQSELWIEFRDSGRNRAMRLALMTAGFTFNHTKGDVSVFSKPASQLAPLPPYVASSCRWED